MLFLIQKEFKQLFRNSFFPRLILVFPIMVVLVMPWVANMEVKNIKLAILDFDKSIKSKQLVEKIISSSYFDISLYATSLEESYECIYQNKCDIILEIPNNFQKDLPNNNANVAIYANAINSTKGTLGSGYLQGIITEFALNAKIFDIASSNPNQINIASKFNFNSNLDYKIYMIPALIVMVLTMLCGFLPAFNIIAEKENGNIEQINVTPIKKSTFILSKIIPYWIIGLIVISICFLLAYLVYGLAPEGSFLSIYLFAIIYILIVTGIGLIISNYSSTMQQAMFVSYFFILILILLSGLFTSIKSMPLFAELLSDINPLRYFILSLRFLYLKGDFSLELDNLLWENLAVLSMFAIIFNLWAILSYKKRS